MDQSSENMPAVDLLGVLFSDVSADWVREREGLGDCIVKMAFFGTRAVFPPVPI